MLNQNLVLPEQNQLIFNKYCKDSDAASTGVKLNSSICQYQVFPDICHGDKLWGCTNERFSQYVQRHDDVCGIRMFVISPFVCVPGNVRNTSVVRTHSFLMLQLACYDAVGDAVRTALRREGIQLQTTDRRNCTGLVNTVKSLC